MAIYLYPKTITAMEKMKSSFGDRLKEIGIFTLAAGPFNGEQVAIYLYRETIMVMAKMR
jgi:hypothetical protein